MVKEPLYEQFRGFNRSMPMIAIIQARMGSKRLPGKVLQPIGGLPLAELIAGRVLHSKYVSQVVLSTSKDKSDDKLVDFFLSRDFLASRHDVDDIVGRLLKASKLADSKYILRLWGDSPFICPNLINESFEKMEKEKLQFFSTCYPKFTYPEGLNFEIYSCDFIEEIDEKCKDPFYREFPAEYIKDNSESIRSGTITLEKDYTSYELVVDYPEDLEVVQKAYKDLGTHKVFLLEDILKYIDANPSLFEKNGRLKRNIEFKEKLSQRKDQS